MILNIYLFGLQYIVTIKRGFSGHLAHDKISTLIGVKSFFNCSEHWVNPFHSMLKLLLIPPSSLFLIRKGLSFWIVFRYYQTISYLKEFLMCLNLFLSDLCLVIYTLELYIVFDMILSFVFEINYSNLLKIS